MTKIFKRTAKPESSMWGEVQHAIEIAPGIWMVMTASHGGMILSEERQKAMPVVLQLETREYEEDVNWCLPVIAFEKEITDEAKLENSLIRLADDTGKAWHSKRYAEFKKIPHEASPHEIIRKYEKLSKSVGEYFPVTAWGDWADWVPQGKVGIRALKIQNVDHLGNLSYTGDPIYALTDKNDYSSANDALCLNEIRHSLIQEPVELNEKRIG